MPDKGESESESKVESKAEERAAAGWKWSARTLKIEQQRDNSGSWQAGVLLGF